MTPASIDPSTKQLVLDLLSNGPLRPTEVLEALLRNGLTPTHIQDDLALLLDTGEIEMQADRRLHVAGVAA